MGKGSRALQTCSSDDARTEKGCKKYFVCGSGRYGEFLGMLASIGVSIAIKLSKKVFGKGLQVTPPWKGKGMLINPSLFFGRWSDYGRKR